MENKTTKEQLEKLFNYIVSIKGNNNFYKSNEVNVTGDQKYNLSNNFSQNPTFTETYALPELSSLKGKATDGKDLGLIFNK